MTQRLALRLFWIPTSKNQVPMIEDNRWPKRAGERCRQPAIDSRRRRFVQSSSLLALSQSLGLSAWARAATGPINWTVGYPQGAGVDEVTRTVAEAMATALGTSVQVNNVPGKGGALATARVVKQPGVSGGGALYLGQADHGYRPHRPFLNRFFSWAAPGARRGASKRLHHRLAHLACADLGCAFAINVRRPQALRQHFLHRRFDAIRRLGLIQ